MSYGITFNFPQELLNGLHNIGADVFKMALYSVELDQTLAAYTSTNEIVGGSYVAGGQQIDIATEVSGNTTSVVIANEEFAIPTGVAAVLIYNETSAGRSMFVGKVGVNTGGTLTIKFTQPLIRLTV